MRLHVISLPHTETTAEYSWCAYTQKVKKFCDMMMPEHEVYLYAGVNNEANCSNHITCVGLGEQVPNGFIPEFDPDNQYFKSFNDSVIRYMKHVIEDQDIICLIGGRAQQPIKEAFPNHIVCEFGIGYSGIMPDTYHVFESYAWMHSVYGSLVADAHQLDGKFYDTVIPNYFDVNEFHLCNGSRDYLLYFGRLIERKGVQIAIDVAERTGLPLHVAGSGSFPLPDWVEHHGVVGPEERADLMGNALALLAPTLYVEPFGGVTIEAMLCGTPAITTDWGAFTETIDPHWRCNSIQSFVDSVHRAKWLSPEKHVSIRNSAIKRFSLEAIAPKYNAYFEHLDTLWGDGFYHIPSA